MLAATIMTNIKMTFITENEIKTELESADFQSKLTAYSGRQYPIEYLSSREFEILVEV